MIKIIYNIICSVLFSILVVVCFIPWCVFCDNIAHVFEYIAFTYTDIWNN